MTTNATNALKIWRAGVDAVRADALIADQVHVDEGELFLCDESIDLHPFKRVTIVGAGKAAAPMATSLHRMLSRYFPVQGWINVPAGTEGQQPSDAPELHIHVARPAGANEPTEAAVFGTRQIVRMLSETCANDLVLVVLTGGGSALLTLPAEGITLADKITVTRHLSAHGANIHELNTVRKQLSDVKGGRLLRNGHAGFVATVILSDVLGDPLDVIASGPTVPNPTTAADALAILDRYDPDHLLPHSIYHTIRHRIDDEYQTPIPRESVTVVLGNNATAVDAAGVLAERLGFSHAMTAAIRCEGSAESVGRHLAEMAVSMARDLDAGKNTPDCLISGGEPTVCLPPPHLCGKGGRNTHVVLAAMQRFVEMQTPPDILRRIVLLSAGTDGEDGPTDAAGAMMSENVWVHCNRLKLDISDHLHRCDSYTFFQRTSGLVITGPTLTNVCDLRVITIAHHIDSMIAHQKSNT